VGRSEIPILELPVRWVQAPYCRQSFRAYCGTEFVGRVTLIGGRWSVTNFIGFLLPQSYSCLLEAKKALVEEYKYLIEIEELDNVPVVG